MLWLCFKLPSCLFGNTRDRSVMHEKAKFVCFIYMQWQKVKFKSVQINMKQVSYLLHPCLSERQFLISTLYILLVGYNDTKQRKKCFKDIFSLIWGYKDNKTDKRMPVALE